jgi:hypothetical protein
MRWTRESGATIGGTPTVKWREPGAAYPCASVMRCRCPRCEGRVWAQIYDVDYDSGHFDTWAKAAAWVEKILAKR